jgi:hypothetical protein
LSSIVVERLGRARFLSNLLIDLGHIAPAPRKEEEREELANHIAEKNLDILLIEGFLMLAGIENPELTAPLRQEAPWLGILKVPY